MKFKFKGIEYTYDELKNAKVTLITDICKSLNMQYKYYAPFLYKNRDVLIAEFFNRQKESDFEYDKENIFEEQKDEKFKYSYENNFDSKKLEDEMNKFFVDISKIDIESIFENVNDAIININQDEVINKGNKFAHHIVNGFDELFKDSFKNTENQEKSNKKYKTNEYITILNLEQNNYNYKFKDKFVNAFRRYRVLEESSFKMLVVKQINDEIKLEKIKFKFEDIDDILNVKCEIDTAIENIKDDKFNFIFLDRDVNTSLIKNVINIVSDLKVEMLEDNEITREMILINEYIDNGEINILLSYKESKEILDEKVVFYKNAKGENKIIIDQTKDECDLRRIKTAKILKIFSKSHLSQKQIEIVNIDFTKIEMNIALDAEFEKYKEMSELDLIINFKKIENDKLSYRVFMKEDGKLKQSDQFITLY